ncbi:MAG: M2 family metallopeptidase [Chloroflexi bacterium]|nr:M2 family metallopeptidase [Chloroflexota bacterium]
MSDTIQDFIETAVAQLKLLERAYYLGDWEAATSGTPEANQRMREAQSAYIRFLADPARHQTAKQMHQSGAAANPLVARQVKLLYLLTAAQQQDAATTEALTALEADVRDRYYNFRGVVGGRKLSDNELDDILGKTHDSALAQEAWEASKQVGAQVADAVRQLARLRNAAARKQGFRDFFQQSLTVNEIDEGELLSLFERLDAATREPFAVLKREIDAARSEHFDIAPEQLRPWHFGDRFFQSPPDTGEVEMDSLFADHDPVELALKTYDGLGMDVRDILARSDLYAREGKNQHAFCTDIDREGDIRTLDNLLPNHRWTETLLHELGHGVYNKHVDASLPWLLRQYPHLLSTEAIAITMGGLTYDREWLEQVLGIPAAEAARVAKAARAQERALRLIFTRWCLVMTHFERALYGDPEQDLDRVWWDLVKRHQLLTPPDGRAAPDWAAKIHVALVPVYYHNYELGTLVTAQLQHMLRRQVGGIVGRKQVGQWLMERFFKPGAREDWSGHIKTATGEPLNPQYFVDALRG